ncbi:protein of unknown function [Pseudomonas sp. NFACC49-2]|uniref:DUF4276 family protein n=1 Tax=Pseudomonas sp. NFACC49-2 TaxID=1566222 RepID=UPI00091AD0D3|nr:DUF4276 family protein [Pseudomonas sp. NFACC49-2]SFY08142.1 protein of unknown function [Pseudomonas sp. NFACC49-2]
MAIKIGVIAEDISDIQVISEILSKYLKTNSFSIKHFVGKGCGKLKNKCKAWVENLIKQGCEHIFIFHDLDRNNETQLRDAIKGKISALNFKNSLIVIPVEELEAWLLSDINAIRTVFSITAPLKQISNAEMVKSPKEHIEKIVRQAGNKIYLNTVHNKKIANLTLLEQLKKCSSYMPLHTYIFGNIPKRHLIPTIHP